MMLFKVSMDGMKEAGGAQPLCKQNDPRTPALLQTW